MKRYDTLKLFLHEVIGVEEKRAETEADLMKHNVSEDTIQKLEHYIKEMLDLNDLHCCYDETSTKCKQCHKIETRMRIKNKIEKGK